MANIIAKVFSKFIKKPAEIKYLEKAMEYQEKNNYMEAEKYFTKAIKRKPSITRLYKLRGQVRMELGDYAGAGKDFSLLVMRKPDDPENYYYRGLAREKRDNMEGACKDYAMAAKHGVIEAKVKHGKLCK